MGHPLLVPYHPNNHFDQRSRYGLLILLHHSTFFSTFSQGIDNVTKFVPTNKCSLGSLAVTVFLREKHYPMNVMLKHTQDQSCSTQSF